MKTSFFVLLFCAWIVLLMVACRSPWIGTNSQTDTPSDLFVASPTPTPLSLAANVVTETPETPLPAGYFELHARTVVQTEQDCVVIYPFTARKDGDRLLLEGDGIVELECRYEGEFCGEDGCMMMHMQYLMDTSMESEVISLVSEPEPSVHVFYNYDGDVEVYYSGLPPEAPNPWTAEHPMSFPLADIATVVMPFKDGANITFPVGIALDQQMLIEQPTWELVLRLR